MMTKTLDFVAKAKIARSMSMAGLEWSISDCMEASKHIDTGYYQDEASVYRQELNRRKMIFLRRK